MFFSPFFSFVLIFYSSSFSFLVLFFFYIFLSNLPSSFLHSLSFTSIHLFHLFFLHPFFLLLLLPSFINPSPLFLFLSSFPPLLPTSFPVVSPPPFLYHPPFFYLFGHFSTNHPSSFHLLVPHLLPSFPSQPLGEKVMWKTLHTFSFTPEGKWRNILRGGSLPSLSLGGRKYFSAPCFGGLRRPWRGVYERWFIM